MNSLFLQFSLGENILEKESEEMLSSANRYTSTIEINDENEQKSLSFENSFMNSHTDLGLPFNNKKEEKLAKNRLAAKESRRKRKLYVEDLEKQVNSLKNENKHLKLKNIELRIKLAQLGYPVAEEAELIDSKQTTIFINNEDQIICEFLQCSP